MLLQYLLIWLNLFVAVARVKTVFSRDLTDANKHVMDFLADMGGTELLSALKNAVKRRTTVEDMNTEVILLTDGEVWNTEETIDFIRSTRNDSGGKVRFFTLGIGNAVSHRLIEGIGRQGGGFAEVVTINFPGSWESRVIRMLKDALTPSQWKCEIFLSPPSGSKTSAIGEVGTPDSEICMSIGLKRPACLRAPYHIPILHPFTCASIYFLLERNTVRAGQIIIISAEAPNGEKVSVKLSVEHVEDEASTIHFLAAKAAMNDLETGQSWLDSDTYESFRMNDPTGFQRAVRNEAENLGRQWCISGRWTSFVAVDTSDQIEHPTTTYRPEWAERRVDTSEFFSALRRTPEVQGVN